MPATFALLSPRRWVTAFALLVAATTLALAADPIRVPGTRAALSPPDGFSASQRFPGFERAQSQASIVVTEIPAPSAEVMKGMTKESLAAKGMALLTSTPVKIDEKSALLLELAQSAGGATYRKWMLVSGDASVSVMVVATFPEKAMAEWSAPMRAAVLSTTLAQGRSSDPLEGLPFKVAAGNGLKLAGRMSNMLLFNESGARQGSNPREAMYVVGPSIGIPPTSELRVFAEQRARQTAQLRDLRIVTGKGITVDGLAAYELLADAVDRASGSPIRLYQVIAPDACGYYIMQGLVGQDRAESYLSRFRAMTQSFRRTR